MLEFTYNTSILVLLISLSILCWAFYKKKDNKFKIRNVVACAFLSIIFVSGPFDVLHIIKNETSRIKQEIKQVGFSEQERKDEQTINSNKSMDKFPTKFDGIYQEIVINGNIPAFDDLKTSSNVWASYSDLDYLNRVGAANALIGVESFPISERKPLNVKPTGWKQKKLSDNNWLYNRCHLIGFQLTGENDNPKNLMTGTRSLNTPHMLNYENQIKTYINNTNDKVRYRVTPHFVGEELLARGVQLEAQSLADDGLAFNVYIYNIQDGYELNYATGSSIKNSN